VPDRESLAAPAVEANRERRSRRRPARRLWEEVSARIRLWEPRHILPAAGAVLRASLKEAWADRIFGLAAEAAFWALLSLTPLLLVLVAAVGYLTPLFGAHITVELEQDILRGAGHFLAPAAVQDILKPVLTDVLARGRGEIISLSFPLALWTGSTAMNTYVNTITIAYGMRHMRSAVRGRLVAFVLYLGALVAGSVALPLLVATPNGSSTWPRTRFCRCSSRWWPSPTGQFSYCCARACWPRSTTWPCRCAAAGGGTCPARSWPCCCGWPAA